MKIDRNLNLVIPVERNDESKVWVHSAPIGLAAFESNFLLLSKTFSAMYSEGIGVIAGPRVVHLLLKKIAEDAGIWENEDKTPGDAQRLMAEIHRLTNVVAPTEKGWDTFPYDEALRRNYFDPEDVSELESAILFFTLAWRLHRRTVRLEHIDGALKLWGGQTSSSNVTEFKNSLPISTPAESTGATAAASSVPS